MHKIVVALLAASLLASPLVMAGLDNGAPKITNAHVAVSWPTYESLADLVAASDSIVVVSTQRLVRVDVITPGAPPRSMYEFHVLETIKGAPAATFRASQTGGLLDGVRAEVTDDPLMIAGDRYVLFLAHPTEQDGTPLADEGVPRYKILGGAQGRLLVKEDRLYSLDTIDPDVAWTRIRFAGEPVALLAQEVARLV